MQTRRATLADTATLETLGRDTFVETFGKLYTPENLADFLTRSHSAAYYARALDEPGNALWIAEDDNGHAVAYAMAGRCRLPLEATTTGPQANAGEVRRLYVRASAQNHRLGAQLMDLALDWLKSQQFAPVFISVWSENYGAQRFYARYGFEKVGEYDFPVGKHLDREFILHHDFLAKL